MTNKNIEIAQTIINQMGGAGKISAMVAGKNFVAIDNGVKFQFKGCKKSNIVQIKLNGMDTYDIEFFKLNMKKVTCDSVKEINGIYNNQLKEVFENETGLYLSL